LLKKTVNNAAFATFVNTFQRINEYPNATDNIFPYLTDGLTTDNHRDIVGGEIKFYIFSRRHSGVFNPSRSMLNCFFGLSKYLTENTVLPLTETKNGGDLM